MADTKLELFVKTTTSLYGSCIQIYRCLHFSVKLEHNLKEQPLILIIILSTHHLDTPKAESLISFVIEQLHEKLKPS